ncbi:MAG: hypothetical protein JWM35_2784, partial [Verrucomicrobia bacterium]|nr:hypothetical protein [Verrucomicrobiota bacterium]
MKNFACVLVLLAATLVANSADRPTLGERFVFEQAGRHVPVWYFQPKSAGANAPVVFVMHGVKRNAEDYLRDWAPYAEKRN